MCCVCACVVNVKKWEDTVAEDERELEKLKRDENKQMKVIKPATIVTHAVTDRRRSCVVARLTQSIAY